MNKAWKHYILLGFFTLQMLVSPFLNAAVRINLQSSVNDEDILLICTGSKYQWISLSQSAQTGDFVFVDAPENAPALQDLPDCLWAWQNANPALKQVHLFVVPAFVLAEHLGIKAPSAIVQAPFNAFLSRAPPSLSIA